MLVFEIKIGESTQPYKLFKLAVMVEDCSVDG
jgi:hypothetical protein